MSVTQSEPKIQELILRRVNLPPMKQQLNKSLESLSEPYTVSSTEFPPKTALVIKS